MSFKKATIEISNICNAKCTWCTTELKNETAEKSGEDDFVIME